MTTATTTHSDARTRRQWWRDRYLTPVRFYRNRLDLPEYRLVSGWPQPLWALFIFGFMVARATPDNHSGPRELVVRVLGVPIYKRND